MNRAKTPGPAGAGVREIRYRADGGAEVVVPGAVATVTLSTSRVHAVSFLAVDALGNAEAARTVTVSIDRAAPLVALAVLPSSIRANGTAQSVLVTGGAADLPSGVASVQITVTDRAGAVVATRTAFNQRVSLLGTPGQLYTVTAVVADRAGNVATATRQVTVR